MSIKLKSLEFLVLAYVLKSHVIFREITEEDSWEQGGGPWYTMILWQLQNIVENGLLMRIMAESQVDLPEAGIYQPKRQLKKLTKSYCRCTKGLFICSECYEKHVIDSDT